MVSDAAGILSLSIQSLQSLPPLWLEAKSSHVHLNDFVSWHMSLLAHSRMCEEFDLPCRRISKGIGSLLIINGPFKQTERYDPEERVGNMAVLAERSQIEG